jgi:DNA-binding beta-propeller fold protein YncE
MKLFVALLFSIFSTALLAANFVYIMNANDGTILILNAADHSEVATVTASGVGGSQVSIAISPDGRRLYALGWLAADVVSLFNINPTTGTLSMVTGMPIPFPAGSTPFGIAISPDSSNVYITMPGAMTIGRYDADLNLLNSVSTGANQPHGIAISPGGDRIYVAYTDTGMADIFTNTLAHTLGGPVPTGTAMIPGQTPYFVAASATGNHVYVTNAQGNMAMTGSIIRFDQDLMNPLAATTDLLGPIGIAVDATDSLVYVANTGDSSVAVLNTSDFSQAHAPLPSAPGGGNNCYITALNPDETLLYTTYAGMGSQSLKIFDVNNNYAGTAVPYMNPLTQFGIAFTPSLNLRSFIGVQKKNDFGLVFELFNHLQWNELSANAAGFYIYRDGVIIATLGGTVRQYDDHNIEPGVSHTYTITAFDFTGSESLPSTVVVN